MYQRRYVKTLKLILLFASVLSLSACLELGKKTVEPEPEPAPPVVKALEFSAEKLANVSKKDIRFAQTALNKLGFKIGPVDGLWGPRSAAAIRQFEAQQDITSANGHLSELNLKWLERTTFLSRTNFEDKKKKVVVKTKPGISSKLKKTAPLSQGPQLIIVDREYVVLSKPNPYSSTLTRLAPGTGIYIIAKQDGWFEVESIDRLRGFVRVD